jgi:HTH-type transcriptional regulator/antitoxin HigA
MAMTKIYPVPPPGLFIREELEARGWTQRDLAYILGCPEQSVNVVLSGKRGISSEMAKALGKAFDVEPELFINLQRRFDLAQAPEPNLGVEQRARFQNQFPIREMIKRGWLQDTDAGLLEVQVAQFFECSSREDIPYMAHAAFKTRAGENEGAIPTSTQLGWLYRVRQIAKTMSVPRYTEKMLRDYLPRIKQLTADPEETRHIPRLLMECGVRFILVEPLAGAKIDGVCFWLDSRAPVIGMSLRYDRIDNFWFVLPHELEHVLQRHGMEGEIIDTALEGDRASVDTTISAEERIANKAAANFCFSNEEFDSFIARKQPFFYERDILGFARRMQVHPGIVVGRVQWQTGRYNFLRKYQVKVRQFVTSSALVDGWGVAAPMGL